MTRASKERIKKNDFFLSQVHTNMEELPRQKNIGLSNNALETPENSHLPHLTYGIVWCFVLFCFVLEEEF